MNKKLLALFDRAAVERRRFGCTVVRSFDPSLSAAAVFELARRQNTPGSAAVGDFFVKHQRVISLSDWRRGLQRDQASGLLGGYAEAINTLAANLLGLPSHQLLGHARNVVSGRSWAVFGRLFDMQSLESFLASAGASPAAEEGLAHVAAALTDSLQRGLYHGDTNASNIFLGQRGRVRLIDHAITLNLAVPVGWGLALQFSKMWDKRIKGVFEYPQFCEIVRRQLMTFGEPAGLEKNFARFRHYSETRNSRARRLERLLEASGGNPDYLKRLPDWREPVVRPPQGG